MSDPVSLAVLILSIIRMIATEGLPALNAIAAEIQKWKGAENIPIEVWDEMLARHKREYDNVVQR